VTEDFIITTAGVDVAGRENFKTWVAGFQSKIADLEIETIETVANLDGSRVSSRWRVTGHNNGMFGLPADGKPVAFTGNAILAVTPTGNSPTTGSNAAPGSSTPSSTRRSTTAIHTASTRSATTAQGMEEVGRL
jgi:hypothetical protein